MRPPEDPGDWDEFQWEQALRESDEYAQRYFEQLKRFYDLPGAAELIARNMGPDFAENVPDCDLNCEDCEDRWDCAFCEWPEWMDEDDPDDSDGPGNWNNGTGDADTDLAEDRQGAQPQPGDALFYESNPVFVQLRDVAMGWSNIYAAILPDESRIVGLKVLFHVGRALANLAYCIGDGLRERPAASIAFAKRCLGRLNSAIGLVTQLRQEVPRLNTLLKTVNKQMLDVRHGVLGILNELRHPEDLPF